jgi:hypothetical protein
MVVSTSRITGLESAVNLSTVSCSSPPSSSRRSWILKLSVASSSTRWELSLFQDGPFRAEQLRESLAALLAGADGLWAAAVRGAILLGETPRARAELQERLSGDPDPDVVRRAIVETILHGDRTKLVKTLDESILGLRPAPTRHIAVADTRALAG